MTVANTKTCNRCGEKRPLGSGFYRHSAMPDGHLNQCVECVREARRKHRKKNLQRAREYDRDRGCRCDPNKQKARRAVKQEIDMGRIERPSTCSSCGGGGAIEAHHEDYGRPLDVTWLCIDCHRSSHRTYGSF